MKNIFCALFLLVGAVCLKPMSCVAATSVTMKESQSMAFPMMGVPSSGTVNLTLSPSSSATSGSAQVISGIANRGVYALSSVGTDGLSISIDITGVDTGVSGLTLGNFKGVYNGQAIDSFPSSTLALPAISPASTSLYLGATVTAGTTVPVGTRAASFSITVFVQ